MKCRITLLIFLHSTNNTLALEGVIIILALSEHTGCTKIVKSNSLSVDV